MENKTIGYKDLSGWLKFAFIFTLINAGSWALLLLLYMIAGMMWLS